ncbi:hypothetical protein MHYP_G00077920 [Metynnis hypsauchen]
MESSSLHCLSPPATKECCVCGRLPLSGREVQVLPSARSLPRTDAVAFLSHPHGPFAHLWIWLIRSHCTGWSCLGLHCFISVYLYSFSTFSIK